MASIADRIKLLRTSHNLTQKQLAELLSIKEYSAQRFEYGTARPNLDHLIALANYFNVSTDFILGLSDNPERR